jgi:2-methylcitrate dehydratase PrpD
MTAGPLPTRQLARFVLASRWEELPTSVRDLSLRAFVNWVGCAYGGVDHPAVTRTIAGLMALSGAGDCTVIGSAVRMPPGDAALVNGMSVGVNAFDDAHVHTVIHPAAPTIAALLAYAERHPVSGRDFLHAIALSHEIQCRLSFALAMPPASTHLGHYLTGIVAGAGVAAGLGKLMQLSEQQLIWAIGLAVIQAGGLRVSHASMASPFIPGAAGRTGLVAAHMAAANVTCQDEPLTAPFGLLPVIGNPAHPAALTDDLGVHWESLNVALKPYPNGVVVHAATDACLDLARRGGFDLASIERIDIQVSPLTVRLGAHPHPRDEYEAWVSVPHWAAAALVNQAAGLYEASLDCISDPRIASLRDRVFVEAAPDLQPDEARATITLANGRRLSAEAIPHRGSARRPLTDDEIRAKFAAQASLHLDPDQVEALAAICWNLEGADDVGLSAPSVWGSARRL